MMSEPQVLEPQSPGSQSVTLPSPSSLSFKSPRAETRPISSRAESGPSWNGAHHSSSSRPRVVFDGVVIPRKRARSPSASDRHLVKSRIYSSSGIPATPQTSDLAAALTAVFAQNVAAADKLQPQLANSFVPRPIRTPDVATSPVAVCVMDSTSIDEILETKEANIYVMSDDAYWHLHHTAERARSFNVRHVRPCTVEMSERVPMFSSHGISDPTPSTQFAQFFYECFGSANMNGGYRKPVYKTNERRQTVPHASYTSSDLEDGTDQSSAGNSSRIEPEEMADIRSSASSVEMPNDELAPKTLIGDWDEALQRLVKGKVPFDRSMLLEMDGILREIDRRKAAVPREVVQRGNLKDTLHRLSRLADGMVAFGDAHGLRQRAKAIVDYWE